jgi:hypothetical protein
MEDISTSTVKLIESLNATKTVAFSDVQFSTLNNSLQDIVTSLGNQSFFETQLFAVFVGALVGLLPTVYLLYMDRPRIRVGVNHILAPRGDLVSNGFSINISNSGRRPVNITRVFLRFKDGSSLVWFEDSDLVYGTNQLPMSLGEGQAHSVTVLAYSLAQALDTKKEYPVAACYADAVGNEYICKTKPAFWETVLSVAKD